MQRTDTGGVDIDHLQPNGAPSLRVPRSARRIAARLPQQPLAQRGQVLLVILVALVIGSAAAYYAFVGPDDAAIERDKKTTAAMAQAKRALIGWSAARTPTGALPNARPGELPCPDSDNDGFENGNCVAGAVGRVPWKTLGIPEPKDAAGETLWYAIAGPFRIWNVNNEPIHSDTKGSLTVYKDSTASAITTEAVAVLFAPGGALGAQNRDTAATAWCPTTGTTIARNLCAANYLETADTVNNSTTNGPFISAPSSVAFNDQVMVITTADLMPIVEQRVAREVRRILQAYKTATAAQGYNGGAGTYPWADCSDGTSDIAQPIGTAIDGSNKGRIAWQNALPVNWGSGTPATPVLPNWLTNQGTTSYSWIWVIYYAVGKNFLEGGGTYCGSCEPVGTGSPPANGTLSVNGAFGKEVVLIMTGPAGANRPSVDGIGSGICDQPQWAAYLEDPENNDLYNDRFVTPSSTAYARDRIYTIP